MLRRTRRIAAFLLFSGLAAAAAVQPAFGQRPVEEIREIIREYLLENPEVIFEAARRYQEKQARLQAERDRAAVRKHAKGLFADPDSFVGGDPQGDVTLVEFFDYRCGYCKRLAPVLEQVTRRDPKLRVVYKEFPVLGEDSFRAAQAALAARGQGRYLDFHDALMKTGGTLTDEAIMSVARSVGLDVDQLRRDMEAPAILNALSNNRRLAQALGITGTPALIIGDQVARGAIPLQAIQQMIARARAKGS